MKAGALRPDPVPRRIGLPPQHRVASLGGLLQGKSAIGVAQHMANKQRTVVGPKLWARGSFVSTVGLNEQVIRASSEHQEKADKRLDALLDREERTLTASSGSLGRDRARC